MNETLTHTVNGASRWLHNIGASMSRTQWVHASSDLVKNCKALGAEESISLTLPENMQHPKQWVEELAARLGLHSWADIEKAVMMPAEKWMVQHQGILHDSAENSAREQLRAALILSKCNSHMYVPDSPAIFTRTRLHRRIRLVRIQTSRYYDLD
jgi:hypothetical protein